MNVQLSILRHLIFERLNPAIDANLSANEIEVLRKEIVSVRFRLLDAINNAIFSTMEETVLLRHIGQVQNECVYLNDVLHGYGNVRPEYAPMAVALNETLATTMDYISGYNGKYFDRENRLPESKKQAMLDALRQDSLVLAAKLKSRGISGRLPLLLQDSLKGMEDQESISYRQMGYMTMMLAEVLKLLSLGRSRNWERKLALKLIFLNFNKTSFFNYCIGVIAAAVDAEKTRQKQVQLFGWYGKEIKKLANEGKGSGYSTSRPGIIVLIGIYISAELEYLMESGMQQLKDTFKNRADSYRLRLKMNMPVGAFALHIQSFIATELFSSEIKMNVINQFMADNYCTIGTDSFTANSFDKKRTELDDASYRIVDRHLVDMRAYLKRRFEGE
ncbi:MAG: hypothetical protein V4594_03070 [Bacteroidota bacterium]